MIQTTVEYDGGVRKVQATYKSITVAFAVYRWPWFPDSGWYPTVLHEIIYRVGIMKWLAYPRHYIEDGFRIVAIRLACVAVGVKWEVRP